MSIKSLEIMMKNYLKYKKVRVNNVLIDPLNELRNLQFGFLSVL